METKRKQIDLDDKVIELLQIQAIKTGHKNFKKYAEHILKEQSMVKQLKDLQK